MQGDTDKYNKSLSAADMEICDLLAEQIQHVLPEAENKIWHAHPVWFLDGNPVVGYSKLKSCVRLLFWSGQTFDEEGLKAEGSFKAAEARYTAANQVDRQSLKCWLERVETFSGTTKTLFAAKGSLSVLNEFRLVM